MKPIRILGVGNIFAGDDAIGAQIGGKLEFNRSELVEVVEAGLSGLHLLDLMEGAEAVILIDAIFSGRPPGTIHRLEIPRDLAVLDTRAWNSQYPSTHSFGLGESLTIGATLRTLPPTVVVFGIEVRHTTFGENLSPEVHQATETLIKCVQTEVEKAVSHIGMRGVPAE